MNRTVAIFVAFLSIAGISWLFTSNQSFVADAGIVKDSLKQKQITIHHTLPITVDVADTEDLQVEGLSGRASLEENHGLLMIFSADDKYGIWMKDMNFPIDVLWIDANGKIVFMYEHMAVDSYPTIYTPPTPVRYVLELPAGFVEAHNILVGDSVEL